MQFLVELFLLMHSDIYTYFPIKPLYMYSYLHCVWTAVRRLSGVRLLKKIIFYINKTYSNLWSRNMGSN